MTRTGRALVIGPVVVLALWVTAVAAAPGEPTPAVGDPIAAGPPASAETARMLTLPAPPGIGAPVALVLILIPGSSSGSSRFLRLAACFMMVSRLRSLPHCLRTCTSVWATEYAYAFAWSSSAPSG